MGFRGRNFRSPIHSTKHVVDSSGITGIVTNQILQTSVQALDNPVLANVAQVNPGSKISSIYYSVYFIAEGGEIANEISLIDFYFIKVPANSWTTFAAATLPTPGATGSHINKRHVLHEEKGISGGGNVSLAGVPMVFKGVIKIPRGRQRFGQSDTFLMCARTNFASKFCIKCIYKEYQ